MTAQESSADFKARIAAKLRATRRHAPSIVVRGPGDAGFYPPTPLPVHEIEWLNDEWSVKR